MATEGERRVSRGDAQGMGSPGRGHGECRGSERTYLVCSANSKEAGVLEHSERLWEGQAMGKLRFREGKKTSPGWLRGISDKMWRGKLAFPAHVMCAQQSARHSFMSILSPC